MLKDILLHTSRSYTQISSVNDVYVAGSGIYGSLDADTMQFTTYDLSSGATWKDIDFNGEGGTAQVGVAIKTDGTLWRWGQFSATQPIVMNNTVLSFPTQFQSETNWDKVFGGARSFFSIKSNGTLWGWGDNSSYTLGDGTTTRRSSPVQIGTQSGWSYVTSTIATTLAIKTDGTLWSWGVNTYGPLGNTPSSLNLGKIFSDKTWKKVSAGDSYTLAIDSSSRLWGWGANTIGKIGNNSTTNVFSPVQISAGTTWTDVATNRSSTMGISSDGKLWGWGEAANFRIGTGTTTDRSAPFQVGTDTNWKSTTIGHTHGHAIKTTGTLWSWGLNTSGELGLNDTTQRSVPTQVGTDTNWVKVYSGLSFTIALKSDNTLWGWGLNNLGQLAQNDTVNKSTPTQIGDSLNPNWKDMSVGDTHVIAVKTDGTVWSWGENASQQLGDGTSNNRSSPVQVSSVTDANVVEAGRKSSSIAINSSKQLWFWGNSNTYHFPQDFPNGTNFAPTIWNSAVANPVLSIVSASIGSAFTNAYYIGDDGYLYTFAGGSSTTSGEASTMNQSASPLQVGSEANWKKVEIIGMPGQGYGTVGIKTDGTLWYWGTNNIFRQFNNLGSSTSPIQVGTGSNWNDFVVVPTSTTDAGFIGITTSGTMYSVGSNTHGVLGINNSNVNISNFTQVGTETTWVSASCMSDSGNFTTVFALKSDNSLWGWGYNGRNEITPNNAINRSSPIQIDSQKSWKNKFKKISNTGTYRGYGFLTTDNKLLVKAYDAIPSGFSLTYYPVPALQTALTAVRNLKSISIGGFNTLFVKSDSTLWGWGRNNLGGSTTSILNVFGNNQNNFAYISPVQLGSQSEWSKVSVGCESLSSINQDDFVLAIKNNGTLWAWGVNNYGQLGDGSFTIKSSPVQIGSATNWTDIFTSAYNSYGKNSSGVWYGWGYNAFGQLGLNDASAIKSLPVQILDTNFTKVSIGAYHGLGVKSNGTLWSWGYNANGELGQGDLINRSSPVQIGSATNWKDVMVTSFDQISYAIKTDGTLWTWGNHAITSVSSPLQYSTSFWTTVPFGYIPPVSEIELSEASTSALTSAFPRVHIRVVGTDGTYWGWGDNQQGTIGNDNSTSQSFPIKIGTNTNWKKVSAGLSHTVAIKTDGTLWAWGINSSGAFGNGNTTSTSSPVQVGTDTDWSDVSCRGALHTLALKSNGTLYASGVNTNGQLGNGLTTTLSVMTQIGSATWSKIAAGASHSMAIKTDGTLWSWGAGTGGILGLNSTVSRSSPVQVNVGKSYNMVSVGLEHAMAIDTTNKLWAWGTNTTGQLGDNTTTTKSSPVQVGSSNWKDICAGRFHTVGIRTDGTLWRWGRNDRQQLGDGTSTNQSSPIQVGSDTDWNKCAAGAAKSVAIKSNGNMYGAGSTSPITNLPGAFSSASFPVQAPGTGWSKLQNKPIISQQDSAAFAIKSDGTLWGWGFNGNNGIISTTTANQSTVQVGSKTNWKSAETGAFGAIAVTEDII